MTPIYISVIIPIYNAEKYLEKSIESVLRQSIHNLELILVNDGSTDHSLDVIMKYADSDKRILVIDKEREGVSIARNTAIKLARGKYIAFVDADDYIDDDMFETMYVTLENSKTDIAMCGYMEEFDRLVICIKPPWRDRTILIKDDIKNQLIPCMISHRKKDISSEIMKGNVWRLLINKEFIVNHNIYFNSKIALAEDLLFCIDLLSHSESIIILEKCFYHYVRHAVSTLNCYRVNNLEESLYVHEQLKEKLEANNLLKDNMERFIANRLSMYTCCISNCFRLGAPRYSEKIKIIKKIVMEYQKDQIMIRKVSKDVNVTRYISNILMKYNCIHLLMICFNLKERFRRRYFKCKQI